jgi:hypothetical protein
MKPALVLLLALLCSGCFIIDEIEAGQEIMDAHSPDRQPGAKSGTAAEPSGERKTARQRLAEYYAKQRAKASGPSRSSDPGDAVGRCRIRGSTEFLRRSDCQLRGGTFL